MADKKNDSRKSERARGENEGGTIALDPPPSTEAEWRKAIDEIEAALRGCRDSDFSSVDFDDVRSEAIEKLATEGGVPRMKAKWAYGDWKRSRPKAKREVSRDENTDEWSHDKDEDEDERAPEPQTEAEPDVDGTLEKLARRKTKAVAVEFTDLEPILEDDLDPEELRWRLAHVAQLYSLAARKRQDPRLEEIAAYLRLVQNPLISRPGSKAATKAETSEKRDVWRKTHKVFSDAVGSQRHAEKETNTGPRTLVQEARTFFGCVVRCMAGQVASADAAEELLRTLVCLPLVCERTSVPATGGLKDGGRAKTLEDIASAYDDALKKKKGAQAHLVIKAVLVALGAEDKWVRNTFPKGLAEVQRERAKAE